MDPFRKKSFRQRLRDKCQYTLFSSRTMRYRQTDQLSYGHNLFEKRLRARKNDLQTGWLAWTDDIILALTNTFFSEKVSKTIQIFCFFRVSPLGRSFNSSRFGSKCIRPSPHLALTLALTLTLTLKPPPTPTLTLTLPLTLNKKTA